ncbi:hypothetical protein GQ53DRAFT_853405 [Thozetella sp. PMI_491]|nr:hypothetical protein GQ53DRAFT_853405 [Thozetella sp. PMI_491]
MVRVSILIKATAFERNDWEPPIHPLFHSPAVAGRTPPGPDATIRPSGHDGPLLSYANAQTGQGKVLLPLKARPRRSNRLAARRRQGLFPLAIHPFTRTGDGDIAAQKTKSWASSLGRAYLGTIGQPWLPSTSIVSPRTTCATTPTWRTGSLPCWGAAAARRGSGRYRPGPWPFGRGGGRRRGGRADIMC